jgi:D-3-phosphoglycerate dehydrogenase / 2-oxoglutarate reductase
MADLKVLVNDGMHEEGVSVFLKSGIHVDSKKKVGEELLSEISEFDALSVRSATKVTREIIEKGAKGNLKIIGRAGVGYDNIDVDAAAENGIIVKIAPYGNRTSTAELALGLMISAARNIPQAHCGLKEGIWQKKKFEGTELYGKTLGIIGCGRIGQKLAEVVSGLNMTIIGYDPFPNSESKINYVSMEDLLKNSDFVSLHTGGKDTVIGAKELSLMKPTAYLINASRGKNVEEDALYHALKNKLIAGAGLDVFVKEPKENEEFTSKLRTLDNIVMTSHLGAATKEAQRKTAIEMANTITDFLLKGDFSSSVNVTATIDSEEKETYKLFIVHQDSPGVFAQIDNILSRHLVNIRETSSRELSKTNKALTIYYIHELPTEDIIKEIKNIKEIYSVK